MRRERRAPAHLCVVWRARFIWSLRVIYIYFYPPSRGEEASEPAPDRQSADRQTDGRTRTQDEETGRRRRTRPLELSRLARSKKGRREDPTRHRQKVLSLYLRERRKEDTEFG